MQRARGSPLHVLCLLPLFSNEHCALCLSILFIYRALFSPPPSPQALTLFFLLRGGSVCFFVCLFWLVFFFLFWLGFFVLFCFAAEVPSQIRLGLCWVDKNLVAHRVMKCFNNLNAAQESSISNFCDTRAIMRSKIQYGLKSLFFMQHREKQLNVAKWNRLTD